MDSCCVPPSRLKYKPVTHVIFDLDGTILDTERIASEAIDEVVGKYGKKVSPELTLRLDGCCAADKALRTIEALGLPMEVDEFVTAVRAITVPRLSESELMPGAERLIKHLHQHDIPLAIATSTNKNAFAKKIEKFPEVFDSFDHVVCGGSDPEVENGKPAPDIFLICASRFPTRPRPRDCLVFEDAPNGVTAALAAGMQVVMIPRDYVPYEIWKKATLRLDTLEFMMPELFGLPPFPREEPDMTSNIPVAT